MKMAFLCVCATCVKLALSQYVRKSVCMWMCLIDETFCYIERNGRTHGRFGPSVSTCMVFRCMKL